MWSETEEIWGAILIFTPDCENVFQVSSRPPVKWTDKEAQVIEGSALVVLV